MEITKRAAKTALGFSTDVELSKYFVCTKQAVGSWPEDEPLPIGRQWELCARRPDLFDAPNEQAA